MKRQRVFETTYAVCVNARGNREVVEEPVNDDRLTILSSGLSAQEVGRFIAQLLGAESPMAAYGE